MSQRSPIALLRCLGPSCKGDEAEVVEAALIDGVSPEEMRAADRAWTGFLQPPLENLSGLRRADYRAWPDFARAAYAAALRRGVSRDLLPDNPHWIWSGKRKVAGMRAFGVECEGEMQGLALLRTDKKCRLPGSVGLPMVYVDYLGTAPWNLPELTVAPRFRGNGFVLMAAAMRLSLDNGWEGRVGLHALPGAEDFYRNPSKCGMTDLGIDSMYSNLRYFEIDAAGARAFLKEG